MHKLHQEIKQHRRMVNFIPKGDSGSKSSGGEAASKRVVPPVPSTRRTPSSRSEPPIPVPREERKPPTTSAKPRKEPVPLPLSKQASHGDNESTKAPPANKSPDPANGSKKNGGQPIASADRGKGDVAAPDSSAHYVKTVVRDGTPKGERSPEKSRPAEPVAEEAGPPQEKEQEVRTLPETGVSAGRTWEQVPPQPPPPPLPPKPKEGPPPVSSRPDKPSRPQAQSTCVTETEHELMERLQHELLIQDNILARDKSASSFLENFSQSHPTEPARRHRKADREQEHARTHAKHAHIEEAKHSKPKQAVVEEASKTSSDAVANRKRSKSVHKADPKAQEKSEAAKCAHSKRQPKEGKDQYDSAVLRAVKADEEIQKLCSVSELVASSADESETGRRKAVGDGDQERNTTHEAGRRLAKLRKRLEDSLEQIQKQPGLDKELYEKARSAKMKRCREELEKIGLLKPDIVEVDLPSRSVEQSEVKLVPSTTTPVADVKPASETVIKSQPEQAEPPVDNSPSSEKVKEAADGEPTDCVRHKLSNPPQLKGTQGPAKVAENRENSASPVNSRVPEVSPVQNTRTATTVTSAPPERSASVPLVVDKLPERVENSPQDGQRSGKSGSCTLRPSEPAPRRESVSIPEDWTLLPKQTTVDDSVKKPENVAEPTVQSKFVSRSGKILDEDSLDAILEHQSKRREHLRNRRRSPISSPPEREHRGPEADAHPGVKEHTRPRLVANPDTLAKPEPSAGEKGEQRADGVKAPGSPVQSSLLSYRTTFLRPPTPHIIEHEATKPAQEGPAARFACNTAEENLLSVDSSDYSHYTSKRSLRHLRYEEPEIPTSKTDPAADLARSSPESLWSSLDGDPVLGVERESSACRRVRWRRQAERAERQRTEADRNKTPPPIPPKVTRLSDIVEKVIGSQKWGGQESKPLAHSLNPSMKLETERKDSSEGNKKLGVLPYECKSTQAKEKSGGVGRHIPTPVVSSRLVRGSFICTVKDKDEDKNTVLAAGESGLVKGPPENVDICEEKSLTPSMAASVFDPKAQLEREKQKQEVERAARYSRMERSPQFKANINLFEHAAGSETPFPENKVRANVKVFEEVSRAQCTGPHSPDRLACGPESHNPQRSPKCAAECFVKPLDY